MVGWTGGTVASAEEKLLEVMVVVMESLSLVKVVDAGCSGVEKVIVDVITWVELAGQSVMVVAQPVATVLIVV